MDLVKWRNTDLSPSFESFLEPYFSTPDFWPSNGPRMNVPAVNVSETEKAFELDMAVPGKSKEDFDITVENDTLCISSESETSSETEEKNFTRKEFSYSSFKRSFRLPENTKGDKIDAKYTDGVLHVIIPKASPTIKKSKTIKVA